MKYLVFILLVLWGVNSYAQSPYSFSAIWDFEGSVNAGVLDVATATAEDATFGGGVNGVDFVAGNGGGIAYTAQNWPTNTNLSGYLQVCITSNVGTKFVSGSTVSLTFEERRSGTGVRDFEIHASEDGFSTFTSLGGPTTAIPDNTNWRDQGPYDYTVPSGNPTNLCFRIYGFSAEGAGGTWRFDNVSFSGSNALPIFLTHFSGITRKTDVLLSFATATETNNDYFAIERSVNGLTFNELARIKGAGTVYEPQQYQYIDTRPLPGKNFYRLRQVDFDGQFSYSPVVIARFVQENTLKIAPMPASDEVQILLSERTEKEGLGQVFDYNGRLMHTFVFPAETDRYAWNLGDLPAGGYVLRLVLGEEVLITPMRKIN